LIEIFKMFVLLLFALSVFTAKDAIVIDSNVLLQAAADIKGDFKIASTPPRVETILFTGLPQETQDTLWTSWGNGLLASNGKYYAAIGNHQGYGGDSFVYEYDPTTGTLKKMIDIAEAIGQKTGQYGHGKIHTPIMEYQGSLYFATYWGQGRQVDEAKKSGYTGSLLFRYDLKNQKLENLGSISRGEGLPGAALDSARDLIYFYSVQPDESGAVLIYDLKKRSVRFKGTTGTTGESRAFLIAPDGKIYFSNEKGMLSFYDSGKNSILPTNLVLPAQKNSLRAASHATSAGLIYGITHAGRLFEFNPAKQSIKDLGPNFLSGEYTAVLLLSPDEKFLYYAPGSHGSSVKVGTPLIQYDIAKGSRKVIAFLGPGLRKNGYCIAGNYNLQIDSKGANIYAVFNGARIATGKNQPTFGLPAFVKITIPASER
jgi:hypothetical protein